MRDNEMADRKMYIHLYKSMRIRIRNFASSSI